jgi:hypothetical protein
LRKPQYFIIRFTRRRIQMAERWSCDDQRRQTYAIGREQAPQHRAGHA